MFSYTLLDLRKLLCVNNYHIVIYKHKSFTKKQLTYRHGYCRSNEDDMIKCHFTKNCTAYCRRLCFLEIQHRKIPVHIAA